MIEPDTTPTPDPLKLDEGFHGRCYYKALAGGSGGTPRNTGFTPAEQRVLKWLMKGLTNGQIAAELGISYPTVKRHISNMRGVSNTGSRIELVAWAAANGYGSV